MSATQQILTQKIVAVVRLDDYARAVDVARALAAGGITVLEFTLTGRGALEAIAAARKALGDAACVGVGTVLKPEDARAAIDSGAQFVVTPAVRKAVIAECVNRNTPILCGGFTPTELLEAYEAGSELVKLFPAQQGGPRYLKDVLAPLPFLKIVPTGGV
ncbi:MAG TPA: bifunctional 4-hydroxy-2-oxoglutarate aldolase/2-dehydro-3-deoxy-phosphogluconate aldolase, partial [Anaerolineales bacterium]|nr:bifunctional 4-hydroxy-2-oxoglutarate aldolase/2-dehydro-3-deoxy-phosphogluconate aldolase [Anaerolineales bacterium]